MKIENIYNEKFTEKEMLKIDAENIFEDNQKRAERKIKTIKEELKSAWIKGFKYAIASK